ncbi:ABC transporter substrate-binding protein [Peptostreptococcus sp.]|uniref:ABC transporter substrate-binding protein n=1 Tax=Peptostreptococcus sp. TaxID=1262 RepID=UPI0025FFDA28|nr:ABC transporter substrate-binding protein [Peptostreptococcus sp.]
MMKKNISKLILLVMSLVLVVGCTATKNSNENDKADVLSKIKANGKLVVGTAPGYPPFEFTVNKSGKSQVVGADIDLAKKIADEIGVKLEIKAMDFDALIMALQSSKVDMVITSMTPTEERKKSVDFSDVYFEGTNSIIVNSNFSKDISKEDDLKNIVLGVQRGSVQEIYAKEALKAPKIKSLTAIPDLIADMKNGNIDGIVASTVVAKINANQYDGLKLIDVNLSQANKEEAAIAIKKGDNKSLLDIVNKTIKSLKDSGQYEEILNKNIDLASKQ